MTDVAGASNFGHRLIPAGDPLSGATFDAIYDQRIKPELERLEAERRRALVAFGLGLAATAMVVLLEFVLTPMVLGHPGTPHYILVLLTVLGGGFLAYLPLVLVVRRAKKSVIQALCEPLGITYELSAPVSPVADRCHGLKLLPHADTSMYEDFFSGQRGDVAFALNEATITQGAGKSRRTVFRGQILRLTRPRKLLSTTVILRDSGWLNRFECPPGLHKVGLEDPKFEQVFEVFGTDQIEARVILTPVFMQELLDLEAGYKGEHLRCAFDVADLLLVIEGPNRFEFGGLFSTLVDRARVKSIAWDLEQVFKLIDRFADA